MELRDGYSFGKLHIVFARFTLHLFTAEEERTFREFMRITISLTFFILFVTILNESLTAQSGNLDPTCNGPGKQVISLTGPSHNISGTIQSDGKIVCLCDQCRRIGLQPDGKVLLAGNTISGLSSTSDLLAVRFDAAGNLDYSFGTYGGVIFDLFGGGETSRGVFVQNIGTQASPDYRIVVTGYGAANGGPSYTFAVRLNY